MTIKEPILISEEGATYLKQVDKKYVPWKSVPVKKCLSDICNESGQVTNVGIPNIVQWNKRYQTKFLKIQNNVCTVILEYRPSTYKVLANNFAKLPYLYFVCKFNINEKGEYTIIKTNIKEDFKKLEGGSYYKYLSTKIAMSKEPIKSLKDNVHLLPWPNFFLDFHCCWGPSNENFAILNHPKDNPILATNWLFAKIMNLEGTTWFDSSYGSIYWKPIFNNTNYHEEIKKNPNFILNYDNFYKNGVPLEQLL